MPKREFLQLAQQRKDNSVVCGWWFSEKLDGQRCFWDGGVTYGLIKKDVPWANHAKDTTKDSYLKCTGLWSRYGNIIHAPDWFVSALPYGICLDGELYAGREHGWNKLRAVVGKLPENVSSVEWEGINYVIFDAPNYKTIFEDGKIGGAKGNQYNATFSGMVEWMRQRGAGSLMDSPAAPYRDVYATLRELSLPDHAIVHDQYSSLHHDSCAFLANVLSGGGEGIMWRNPNMPYFTCRTNYLLKEKSVLDSEGIVVGYTKGEGRLIGLIGALVIEWINGGQMVRFNLSGMTDAEREWEDDTCTNGKVIPIGTRVNFMYRALSPEGLPIEARYNRVRSED